jgi:hypothetical protein
MNEIFANNMLNFTYLFSSTHCEKEFSKYENMKRHVRVVHEVRKKKFESINYFHYF